MLYIGRRINLGLGKESSRGTLAAPTYTLPTNSFAFNTKTTVKNVNSAMGVIEDTSQQITTKKFGEGSFDFDLEDKAIGLILTAMFGAAPTPSGTTNYTHTFALAETNTHQSLTLAAKDPNIASDFVLSMLDTFELSVAPESLINGSVSFRSKPGVDGSTYSPVLTALGNIFNHSHFTFKVATNLAGLGAASAVNLMGLTFKVNKNAVDFNDLGSITVSNILNQNFSVEGTIDLGYSDQVWRDYMINGDHKAVEIAFTYGVNNSLVFQMPRVSFLGWQVDQGLEKIVSQKLTFKAHRDLANGAPSLAAILKNQVATY